MLKRDVERIVRDVLNAQGIGGSLLHVELTPAGWRVAVRDPADRVLTVDLPDGTPAVIRAALERWADKI